MISDTEYAAWLKQRTKRDVVLVDITTDNGPTLRVSTRPYRKHDHIYRARLYDFEVERNVESGLAGYSVFGVGKLRLINTDHKLDDWRQMPMQSMTVRYGSVDWDYADFRIIHTGAFYSVDADGDTLVLDYRDKQADLDTIVTPAEITANAGLPGVLARNVMIQSGQFAAADIDIDSFNALDTAHPYPCEIVISDEGENLSAVLDRILAGFPCDYGIDVDGKMRCYRFTQVHQSTEHRTLMPIQDMRIERVAPYWEANFTSALNFWPVVHVKRANVQAVSPDANTIATAVSVKTQAHATALANDYLDAFNTPMDRCTLDIAYPVSGMDLLDEVSIRYPYYGYSNGRYGRVVNLRNRIVNNNELQVLCV